MIKYIRWQVFLPFLIFLIFLFIFFTFFLDIIIKNFFISLGESIFTAKVNIDYLKTDIKNLSIEIKGLEIADKSDPWKNLFEVEKIKFGVRFLPLLSKKVIIDEFSIEGIKWSTKRDTYGALPLKKVRKINKKIKKEDENLITFKFYNFLKEKLEKEYKSLAFTKDIFDFEQDLKSINLEKIFDKLDLDSPKLIDNLKNEYKNKYENYLTEIKSLEVEKNFKNTEDIINKISNLNLQPTIQSIKILNDNLSLLNENKRNINIIYEKLNTIKNNIQKDFVDIKEISSKLDFSFKKDYNKIISFYKDKIPKFKKEELNKILFADILINNIQNIFYYINLARKYIVYTKKEDKFIVKPRMKGLDIIFVKEDVLPRFWVKKIFVSGSTGGKGKSNNNVLYIEGLASNFSSDPIIVKKPAILKLKGAKDKQEYILEVIFNRFEKNNYDLIKLNFKNLELNNIKISEYLPQIESCVMTFESFFYFNTDIIDFNIKLFTENIKYSFIDNQDNYFVNLLNELIKSIDKIYISLKLHGKINSLFFNIESNIGDVINRKFKLIFEERLEKYLSYVKSELNVKFEEQKEDFLKTYINDKKELLKVYDEKIALLNDIKSNLAQEIKKITLEIEYFNKYIEKEIKKRLFQ